MKLGLLFKPMDPPDGKNIAHGWKETLEAGKLAEDVGFDGLFVPEHRNARRVSRVAVGAARRTCRVDLPREYRHDEAGGPVALDAATTLADRTAD